MTIDKAIKHLENDIDPIYGFMTLDCEDAIKLGIEALKAYKILRSPGSPFYPHILPGETKE